MVGDPGWHFFSSALAIMMCTPPTMTRYLPTDLDLTESTDWKLEHPKAREKIKPSSCQADPSQGFAVIRRGC